MKFNFTKIEQEVIFLKAITELIDLMVNNEILKLGGKDTDSLIMFESMTHQRFFNIILVDFLSCSDKEICGRSRSYLNAIEEICEEPNFNISNSINSLNKSNQEFMDWLNQEVRVDVWLPSINTKTALNITRIEFLKICGNISKHNFSRLSGTVRDINKIFSRNKINVKDEDVLLVLNDFYEKFHSDVLNYHGSTITEFLNNIRWGIYEYLQPEFQRSIIKENGDPPRYSYRYPKGVNNEFSKDCYWELMNKVRRKPYVRKFKVTKYAKLHY